MAILAFQKPDKVIMLDSTETFGRFEFRPLEPGYGITIGNALRRILLSSLEGFAINSIRIDGVSHEFDTIHGVIESVVDIILNLKQVRFKRMIDGVDGEVCNVPSTIVRVGQLVGVRERSKSLEVVQNSLNNGANKYSWFEWDAAKCTGKFASLPERSEVPETINEQLIVELYSK